MNNFFLFRPALNTATLAEFEIGIKLLNEVVANSIARTDSLFRYEKFWDQNSKHGFFHEIPYKLSKEYINL
jgi:hypothetical protein